MKKPEDYELKKWLCDNLIIGLKVLTCIFCDDGPYTKWELIPAAGESRVIDRLNVALLVTVSPTCSSVLQVLNSVRDEVRHYEEFCKDQQKLSNEEVYRKVNDMKNSVRHHE